MLIAISLSILYLTFLKYFGDNYTKFPSITIFKNSFNPTSIIFFILIAIVLIVRKQKLISVGLTTRNLKKSVILGLTTGMPFLIIAVVQFVMSDQDFRGLNYLFYGIVYYGIEIALFEEVLFRGYVQTRIIGVLKNKYIAIFISSVLFMLIHIPFQAAIQDVSMFRFMMADQIHLIITMLFHVLFTLLYYKYNNIAAPTIAHLFINLSFIIFI